MLYFIGYSEIRKQPIGLELLSLKLYILKFGNYEIGKKYDNSQKIKMYIGKMPENISFALNLIKDDILKAVQPRFISFINRAQQRTAHMHDLDAIPKIGNKIKAEVIANKPTEGYTSFEDIKHRSKYDLTNIIYDAISKELINNKYYIRAILHDKREEQA